MPKLELGAYPQMPYEAIDEATYHKMKDSLGKLSFGRITGEEVVIERFCDNDVCQIDFTPSNKEENTDAETEIKKLV